MRISSTIVFVLCEKYQNIHDLFCVKGRAISHKTYLFFRI